MSFREVQRKTESVLVFKLFQHQLKERLDHKVFYNRVFIFFLLLALNQSFEFPIEYLYILQRPHDNDTTPFHIAYQLPLGSVLQPLSAKQLNCVDLKLQELFQTMNLYESEQSYEQKQDKFKKLSSCFQQMFNTDTLHCFSHAFLPYGSFRIVR